MRIKKVDVGNFLKEAISGKKMSVKVGIFKDDNNDSNLTTADIAFINENGGTNIPSRPALNIATEKFTEAENIVLDSNMKKMAHEIGTKLAKMMKKEIKDMKVPPNAPSTILKKGFNDPLIDTKKYLKGISYKINDGELYKYGDEQ